MDLATWELFVAVVAAMGSVEILSRLISGAWRHGPGRRRFAEARINRLANNYQHSRFVDVLGEPAIRETLPADADDSPDDQSTAPGVTYRRSHFVDPLFFVTAIADRSDSVVSWSVTTRSARFRPRIGGPFPGRVVRLNSTPYSRFGTPSDHRIYIGARRFSYSETHWFGNPGEYQWYVLAHNDAGPGQFEFFDLERGLISRRKESGVQMTLEQAKAEMWYQAQTEDIRRSSAFNTFGCALDLRVVAIGPDLDAVRLFADWPYRPGSTWWVSRWSKFKRILRRVRRPLASKS